MGIINLSRGRNSSKLSLIIDYVFELIESNYLFVNGNKLFYFRLLKQESVFRTFSKCVTGMDVLLRLSLNRPPHLIVVPK